MLRRRRRWNGVLGGRGRFRKSQRGRDDSAKSDGHEGSALIFHRLFLQCCGAQERHVFGIGARRRRTDVATAVATIKLKGTGDHQEGRPLTSADQSEPEYSRYDQEDRDDVIEKSGHDQNENAREQGDDGLQMCDGQGPWSLRSKRRNSESRRLSGLDFALWRNGAAESGFEIDGFRCAMRTDWANLLAPYLESEAKEDARHLVPTIVD
jgi:hypothetical protein